MAHILRLEKGGSYLDLNSGAVKTLRYAPISPEISTVDAIATIEDGGERILSTRRNVSEGVDLLFRPYPGTSMAEAETAIQTLELWLRMAEEYQSNGAGNPVYLEFQPSETSGVWRSEILGGKLDIDEDGLSWWASGKKVKGTLVYTRRFFWEGAEAEIRLTNGSGSNLTGGITIYNHDDADAGHDNYVELNGSDIKGSLPAAIRLELTNSFNSATRDNTFFLGLNNFSGMSFKNVLEAENMSYGGTLVTPSAGYSGGNAKSIALTTTIGLKGAWVLDSTMLAQYRGRFFKILGRFPDAIPSDTILKFVIKFPSGSYLTTVAETQETQLSTTSVIQELGSIQLPPWLTQETSLYPVDLCIYGYNLNGSVNLTIDNIFLMPLDGYRILQPKGYGLGYQAKIIDDGIKNLLWTEGWDTPGKTGHYIGFGDRLLIWPSTTCRIFFVTTTQTGSADITRTHSVRVYYRPRRLTV